MPPLLRENAKTPVAYVGGASFLSQSFIGIPHKPNYSASFSPLLFPTTLFFSKTSLNIWKFMVHVLLKPGLENFEHYFTSV